MARIPRSAFPDEGFFHVTSRGVDRMTIFRTDDDRRLWNALLARTQKRFDWICHAYCQMGNHFHLVVEGQRERLSWGMHWLNGLYALEFNRLYGRVGHLFQDRFHTRLIADETHLNDACEYVFMNPVRAELCDDAADWPWSGGTLHALIERAR
jgi:putative transposase